MTYALMTSGGKDSTLALDRALQRELPVTQLVNIFHRPSGRVRFHGVRRELIGAQARAIGLPLLAVETGDGDFESVFEQTLETLHTHGCRGVVFGNIHLADVREWYEVRVRAAGLEHVEPLWHEPPAELIAEFLARGYRAVITSIDLSRGCADLVGREFDDDLIQRLTTDPGIDPCGEQGEYHSFVYDGPLFGAPVTFVQGASIEIEGHAFVDLVPA